MPRRDGALRNLSQRVGTIASIEAILVVAGSAVAGYLVWVHYHLGALVCGLGDCETVQASTYSEFAGIPIAWFGLALFLAIGIILGARHRTLLAPDTAAILLVGATFAGTLAVAWLTYLELWVIDAVCQWCVAFAIITVCLFILSLIDLRAAFAPTTDPAEGSR